MVNPKLVVFDVDGTLLDSAGTCRPATKQAIADLRSHGVTTMIATGRPLALAQTTVALTAPVDWIACGNGSSVVDLATGALFRDITLPAAVISSVVSELRRLLPGVGFALELSRTVMEEADFVRRVPPSPHDPPVADVLAEWARLGSPPVRKIIPYHDEYDGDTEALAHIVRPLLDDRFDVNHGVLPIVEIGVAGDHKAAALVDLTDHLGWNAGDVVAFGDGVNDMEMLRWAGVGVAMGNAADDVKAAADQVTDHVDGAGVVAYLKPLLDSLAARA